MERGQDLRQGVTSTRSVAYRLAARLYLIWQAYWIFSILADLGGADTIIVAVRLGYPRQTILDYTGSLIPGFILLSVIIDGLVIALCYKYRNDWYIRAQRVRIFLSSWGWFVGFFVLVMFGSLTLISGYGSDPVYFAGLIMTLFAVTFGMFAISGLFFSIPFTLRRGIDYGNPEALEIMAHFEDEPKLLRPKTSGPLLRESHSIISSILARGFPTIDFPGVSATLANAILLMKTGTPEQKHRIATYFANCSRIAVKARRAPLEASSELIDETKSLRTEVPAVLDATAGIQTKGVWARIWGIGIVGIVRPYSDVIIIVLTIIGILVALVIK
jgi:hypothetical protein